MKKTFICVLLCVFLLAALLPATVSATTEISTISLQGLRTPKAGDPFSTYNAFTTSDSGISFYGVDWRDETAGEFLEGNDTFLAGHSYSVQIWMQARDGYAFKCVDDRTPAVIATIDGKPVRVTKAYEYKAFAMVVLNYTFPAIGGTTTETTTPTEHTHSYTDWQYNIGQHYKNCLGCDEVFFVESHYGGTMTCTQKPICEVCGLAYGMTEPDHRWSPKYHSLGAAGHAYQCADCKEYGEIHAHIPGPAGTPEAAVVCRDCGYTITPAKEHTHSLTLVPEVAATCMEPGVKAHYICSGCSQHFADASGKTALTDLSMPPLGHEVSEDWKFDEQNHWRVCSRCEARLEETNMAHELAEGKCTTCQYGSDLPAETTEPETTVPETQPQVTEPAIPDAEPEGLPWWAMALLAVGAAALGIGTGIVILVLTRKVKK